MSGDGRGGWSRDRWAGGGRGCVRNVRHLAHRNTLSHQC